MPSIKLLVIMSVIAMKYDEGLIKNISIDEAKDFSIGKAEGIISTVRDFRMSDKDIISWLVSDLHIPVAKVQQMLLNYT